MSPWWIIGAGLLQLAILYMHSPWPAALGMGIGALLILGMFAITRLRWDSHLDMILIMASFGGLGMILPTLLVPGPACHLQQTTSGFLLMTGGMLLLAIPLSWHTARCILEARNEGHGGLAFAADLIGMQAGMMLGHLPMNRWPMGDPRLVWIHHALMLVSMLLGMLASMAVLRWYVKKSLTVFTFLKPIEKRNSVTLAARGSTMVAFDNMQKRAIKGTSE